MITSIQKIHLKAKTNIVQFKRKHKSETAEKVVKNKTDK